MSGACFIRRYSQVKLRKMNTFRDLIIHNLRNPDTPIGIAYNVSLLLLIYVSVGLLIFQFRYPEVASAYEGAVELCHNFILLFFAMDMLLRIVVYRKRLSYLFSFDGVVDLIAVLPGILALVVTGMPNLAWVRSLRIIRFLRFFRLLKFSRTSTGRQSFWAGIMQRLLPWIALSAAIKGIVVSAEALPWWPGFGDMSVMLSVTGFAIAVLLGAKLSIAQTRFYEVEDALCRILGSITDMPSKPPVRDSANDWLKCLRKTLEENNRDAYVKLKAQTQAFEKVLEENAVGGPLSAGFHRDVEFMTHRLRARTPPAIEKFLWYVTCVYAFIAMLGIPGLTGFVMTAFIVFVLGGMYFVIDDIDAPLVEGKRSLISIDLTPLEEYGLKD